MKNDEYLKTDEYRYKKMLYKYRLINNIIVLICFTILAIYFNKGWIIFFSILFFDIINKEKKEDNKK